MAESDSIREQLIEGLTAGRHFVRCCCCGKYMTLKIRFFINMYKPENIWCASKYWKQCCSCYDLSNFKEGWILFDKTLYRDIQPFPKLENPTKEVNATPEDSGKVQFSPIC